MTTHGSLVEALVLYLNDVARLGPLDEATQEQVLHDLLRIIANFRQ